MIKWFQLDTTERFQIPLCHTQHGTGLSNVGSKQNHFLRVNLLNDDAHQLVDRVLIWFFHGEPLR